MNIFVHCQYLLIVAIFVHAHVFCCSYQTFMYIALALNQKLKSIGLYTARLFVIVLMQASVL